MSGIMDLALRVAGNLNLPADLGSGRFDPDTNWLRQFNFGTGSLQFDTVFTESVTLTASQNLDIDLRGNASFTDVFGVTLAMVELRLLMIQSRPTNTGTIAAGGTVTNQITGIFSDPSDRQVVHPGGLWIGGPYPDGSIPIVAGTGDLFRITNLSGSVTAAVDIFALGVRS
jgi:hypothetical protein